MSTTTDKAEPYWCVICGRAIEPEEREDGNYYAHDNVPHPETMAFDEESNPQ